MPITEPSTKPRGASQEYSQRAEGNQDVGQNLNSGSSSRDEVCYSLSYFILRTWLALSSFENPDCRNNTYLTFTQPRGMGPPSGPGNISFKQEGLDNADTMNPYVNEPGKSKKGEGETDSAKVKGTVRPDRPQV